VLVSLTIVASGMLRQHSFQRKTELILQKALAAETAQRATRGSYINHSNTLEGEKAWDWERPWAPTAPDAPADAGKRVIGGEFRFIERFVAAVQGVPEADVALGTLAKESALGDKDGDGFLEVLDGWGTPLTYASLVDHADDEKADDFLPERLTRRSIHQSVPEPKPMLVSAGQDTRWGDHRELLAQRQGQPADEQAARAASDNLYSFKPRP
jgi:hypothetical protein